RRPIGVAAARPGLLPLLTLLGLLLPLLPLPPLLPLLLALLPLALLPLLALLALLALLLARLIRRILLALLILAVLGVLAVASLLAVARLLIRAIADPLIERLQAPHEIARLVGRLRERILLRLVAERRGGVGNLLLGVLHVRERRVGQRAVVLRAVARRLPHRVGRLLRLPRRVGELGPLLLAWELFAPARRLLGFLRELALATASAARLLLLR